MKSGPPRGRLNIRQLRDWAGGQACRRLFHRIMVLLSEKTKSFWISFHGEAGRSLLLFRTRASVSGVPAGRGLLLLFGPLLSARFFNGSSKAVSPLRPVSYRPLLRLLKVEPHPSFSMRRPGTARPARHQNENMTKRLQKRSEKRTGWLEFVRV